MSRTITIGRNPDSDLHIDDSFGKVSYDHATIEEIQNSLYLSDHSRNGTYINGRKRFHEKVEIKAGDVIKLANSYTLTWNELRIYFPKKTPANRPLGGRKTSLHQTPVDDAEWNHFEERAENRHQQEPLTPEPVYEEKNSTWKWILLVVIAIALAAIIAFVF